MSEPSAKVIADSISHAGHRVTSLEVVMHRLVLAEANTHRMFSRNSASSRAIPLPKQLQRVTDDCAFPVSWPSEQKGMQGGNELTGLEHLACVDTWITARDNAVAQATHLGTIGLHKSVVNRLLEPFMWHTVIITATDWDNFWQQRCSPLAQPEIRAAAEAMKAAYDASEPMLLQNGQWHLPYMDEETLEDINLATEGNADEFELLTTGVSAARCARVSYMTQDGRRDFREDFTLFERLTGATPMHASPLEHVCTPHPDNDQLVCTRVAHAHVGHDFDATCTIIQRPRYGNVRGWHQLRFDIA